MERTVTQLWVGADLAAVVLLALFCPFVAGASPEEIGRFYAAYAVLRGLVFLVEGGVCWGRLYLAGLAFWAAAVVMRLVPAYAPLIHAATYSGCSVWMSFQDWRGQPVAPVRRTAGSAPS
jgi:hypothetical protein